MGAQHGSPPFRQSPLQTSEVSCSQLSVLSDPAVAGPAKGPFVGWGPLQRSCVSTPCNPLFSGLIQLKMNYKWCAPVCARVGGEKASSSMGAKLSFAPYDMVP
jgi:hypothetical protein